MVVSATTCRSAATAGSTATDGTTEASGSDAEPNELTDMVPPGPIPARAAIPDARPVGPSHGRQPSDDGNDRSCRAGVPLCYDFRPRKPFGTYSGRQPS